MHVKVRLTQYDLIEHTETVLADGQGILNDTTLFYSEKDNPGVRHEIVLEEKHLVIRRIADIVSETDLIIGERSMARVLSPYGVMVLETYTDEYTLGEGKITAEYHIFQGDAEVTHQKLIWELKGVQT